MFSPNANAFSFLDKAYQRLKTAIPEATDIRIGFDYVERDEGSGVKVPMWVVKVPIPAKDGSGDLLLLDASGEDQLDDLLTEVIESAENLRGN